MLSIQATGSLQFPKDDDIRNGVIIGVTKAADFGRDQAKLNATGRPGPRVVTGRLRGSIRAEVRKSDTEVIGVVGSNVNYARPVELGGPTQVPSHQRTITQVYGRAIKPKRITVRAYTMNRTAYPYMQPALGSPYARARFLELVKIEVDKAVKGGR